MDQGRKPYTLLVVDDELITLHFIVKTIQENDPEWEIVATATDGEEAFLRYREFRPDFVLTDIVMPSMDGLELCRALRSEDAELPIAIITGHSEFSFAQRAIQYGITDYLLKPIRIRELIELLKKTKAVLTSRREARDEYEELLGISLAYRDQQVVDRLRTAIYDLATPANTPDIEAKGAPVVAIFHLDTESLVAIDEERVRLAPFNGLLLTHVRAAIRDMDAAWLVQDENDDVVVYLRCANREVPLHAAKALWRRVSAFASGDGVTVTGSAAFFSEPAPEDIRQLYRQAASALIQRLPMGGNAFYPFNEARESVIADATASDRVCRYMLNSFSFDDSVGQSLAARKYILGIDPLNGASLLRYMAHAVDVARVIFRDLHGEAFSHCLFRIRAYFDRPNEENWPDSAVALLMEALPALLHLEGCDARDAGNLVARAQAYIYNHFHEQISLNQLAESLNVTPNYLSSLFSRTSDETYIKFVTRLRMEYAMYLIKQNPHLKVADIALRSGYDNAKYFISVFKKHFGVTPNVIRTANLTPEDAE